MKCQNIVKYADANFTTLHIEIACFVQLHNLKLKHVLFNIIED